ncbi:hypothetical protein Hypma_013332 [Hypsizygus marmoreus]|uniref:Uncharacterized protein n=1 Tax=Hypsizygus marmoreus TaxID=39966 RepID=A0A369JC37_HYPMA|nr:hypothetical protein Hypma_013332 [Hypsizygus marmoreus]
MTIVTAPALNTAFPRLLSRLSVDSIGVSTDERHFTTFSSLWRDILIRDFWLTISWKRKAPSLTLELP